MGRFVAGYSFCNHSGNKSILLYHRKSIRTCHVLGVVSQAVSHICSQNAATCSFHKKLISTTNSLRNSVATYRELTQAMKGSLYHEFQTDLPAAEVWEVYGGLLIGQLVPQLLPDMLSKVELVDGDGGVGTVLLLTFPPGTPGLESYKEKFIKVDNENYVKEAIVVEGGFLDYGFTKYLVRFEITDKTDETSVIRSTIEYEVDEEHISNTSFVSTAAVATIAEAITRYIKEQKSSEQAPKQTSEK